MSDHIIAPSSPACSLPPHNGQAEADPDRSGGRGRGGAGLRGSGKVQSWSVTGGRRLVFYLLLCPGSGRLDAVLGHKNQRFLHLFRAGGGVLRPRLPGPHSQHIRGRPPGVRSALHPRQPHVIGQVRSFYTRYTLAVSAVFISCFSQL